MESSGWTVRTSFIFNPTEYQEDAVGVYALQVTVDAFDGDLTNRMLASGEFTVDNEFSLYTDIQEYVMGRVADIRFRGGEDPSASGRRPGGSRTYVAELVQEIRVPVLHSPPSGWDTLGHLLQTGAATGVLHFVAGFDPFTAAGLWILLKAGQAIFIRVGAPSLDAVGEQVSGAIRDWGEDKRKQLRSKREHDTGSSEQSENSEDD